MENNFHLQFFFRFSRSVGCCCHLLRSLLVVFVFFFPRFVSSFCWRAATDQPQVTLQLGSTLNPDDIKEGDDVYFECQIKANPKEHRITWWHDVSTCTQFYCFPFIHSHLLLAIVRATFLLLPIVWRNSFAFCIILLWVQLVDTTHQSICRARTCGCCQPKMNKKQRTFFPSSHKSIWLKTNRKCRNSIAVK